MKNTPKGILALILLTAIFGSLGIFGRYFSNGFSLFQQVFLRITAAFLLSLILFRKDLHFTKLKKIPPKEWGLLSFRAFTNYVSGVVLFTVAVLNTKLGNVSVIQSLPFVAVFGFLLFGETISKRKIFLITMAFFGVILMSLKNFGSFSSLGKGELFALISSISFSMSYIARKGHSKLLNNKEITTIMSFLAAVFLLVGSILIKEPFTFLQFSPFIVGIILLAGSLNILALLLVNYGFQYVEGSLASNLLTLEAVFGTLYGFLLYKEIPTLFEICGTVLIIGSVILLNQLEARQK